MYAGPIIDTHMHLLDLAHGYAWLNHRVPAFEHLIGDYDPLRRNVFAPDITALTRGWHMVQSVHVQAFGFPDDPVAETAWLQAQADRYGYPHGIVAYAGDYMRDGQWRKGFARLSRHGLVFDLQLYAHQIPDAAALARDFPGTTIVVEHLAWQTDLSAAGFEDWGRLLASLAERPNVFLKVSGIGCVFRRSDPDLVRRHLRQAVATFGPDRCLFGSNCPPDTLFYSFGALLGIYMVRPRGSARRDRFSVSTT